ncbi:hematopoietic SH2 domain-containing protein [Rhinophrynus dorsalis]
MEKARPSVKWFIETQSEWFLRNGIPDWFHGVITRKHAEDLLQDKAPGCFLIRVGESRIGYSLSYRAIDRYRHFMIDVLEGQKCNITGNPIIHKTLGDLVIYHSINPIYPYSEVLVEPCGQKTNLPNDYQELFEHSHNQFTNINSMGNSEKRHVPMPTSAPVHNYIGTVVPPGAVMEPQRPPLPPRRYSTNDCSPVMTGMSPHTISTQAGNRLCPSEPQVQVVPQVHVHSYKLPLSTSADSLALTNKRNVDSSATSHNTANQYIEHNRNGVLVSEKQTNMAQKPFKACQTLMNKAVSRVSDVQIAYEFKTIEHALASRVRNLKENFGHSVPAVQQNVSSQSSQNTADNIVPEEYKNPPPFAPGF